VPQSLRNISDQLTVLTDQIKQEVSNQIKEYNIVLETEIITIAQKVLARRLAALNEHQEAKLVSHTIELCINFQLRSYSTNS